MPASWNPHLTIPDLFGRFSTLCYLGSVSSHRGLYNQARLFYERALTFGETTLASEPLVLAHACLEGYADVLRRRNLVAEAEAVEDRIDRQNLTGTHGPAAEGGRGW